jgi:hypothetical protein
MSQAELRIEIAALARECELRERDYALGRIGFEEFASQTRRVEAEAGRADSESHHRARRSRRVISKLEQHQT